MGCCDDAEVVFAEPVRNKMGEAKAWLLTNALGNKLDEEEGRSFTDTSLSDVSEQ